jgi:amino acid permease
MELASEVRSALITFSTHHLIVVDMPISIVGVSNQLSWIAIGITSIRFRSALALQGKTHLLPFRNWTYPVGPYFVVVLNSVLVLVQGWSCFSPHFDGVSFVSFYIELPVMLVMYGGWCCAQQPGIGHVMIEALLIPLPRK